ncbi:MAG: hypothetical protein MJ247_06875 [Alphaproteobacteria bacterium]|nr:hypothetical protein [Alphaproteobacteria bacterium]
MTNDMKDFLVKMTQIANNAVHNAQEENRRLGIPNVYSINGKLVYEYEGEISSTPPQWWKDFDPALEAKKR